MKMGIGIIGMERECAFERSDRQFTIAELGQNAAQVGTGLDIVLVEFDGRVIAFARRRHFAQAIQQFGHGEADWRGRSGRGGVGAVGFDRGGEIAFVFQFGGQGENLVGGQSASVERSAWAKERVAWGEALDGGSNASAASKSKNSCPPGATNPSPCRNSKRLPCTMTANCASGRSTPGT